MDWKENRFGLASVSAGLLSLAYFLFSLVLQPMDFNFYGQPAWMFWFYLFMFLLLPMVSLLAAALAWDKKEKQRVYWKIGIAIAIIDLLLFLYVAQRALYNLAY
jgi:hypothetical protein